MYRRTKAKDPWTISVLGFDAFPNSSLKYTLMTVALPLLLTSGAIIGLVRRPLGKLGLMPLEPLGFTLFRSLEPLLNRWTIGGLVRRCYCTRVRPLFFFFSLVNSSSIWSDTQVSESDALMPCTVVLLVRVRLTLYCSDPSSLLVRRLLVCAVSNL